MLQMNECSYHEGGGGGGGGGSPRGGGVPYCLPFLKRRSLPIFCCTFGSDLGTVGVYKVCCLCKYVSKVQFNVTVCRKSPQDWYIYYKSGSTHYRPPPLPQPCSIYFSELVRLVSRVRGSEWHPVNGQAGGDLFMFTQSLSIALAM